MIHFKDKIKLLRAKRDWTQPEAARAFGVDLRTLQKWESGENKPRNLVSVEKYIDSLMKDGK